MSEDENQKQPIKLKLSAKGKETDGDKQEDAPTGRTNPPQDQTEDQNLKPKRLELRRKPKQKEDATEKEDTPPESMDKPKFGTTPDSEGDSSGKPELKPRPAAGAPDGTARQEESPPEENPSATGISQSAREPNAPEESNLPEPEPEQEKPKLKTRPPAEEPSTPDAPDAPEATNVPETFEDGDHSPTPAPAPAPADLAPQEEKEPAPADTPPPLPAQETVPAEEPPADDLEEAVRDVAEGTGPSSSSPWLSIIIIVILLAVLGGSGFGLWYVLKAPGDQPAEVTEGEQPVDESAPSADESEGNAMTKSIAKAKKAVESVPTEALDEVTSVEPSTREQAPLPPENAVDSVKPTPAPPAPPSQTPEDPAKSADTGPEPTTAAASSKPPGSGNVDQALVQAVSAYLSKVQISGVRTGERPMVIIDGESHTPGDVVETETGLRFSGIRNGKLAFTDKNTVVYLKSF